MDTNNPEAQWDFPLHPRQSAFIRGSNFRVRRKHWGEAAKARKGEVFPWRGVNAQGSPRRRRLLVCLAGGRTRNGRSWRIAESPDSSLDSKAKKRASDQKIPSLNARPEPAAGQVRLRRSLPSPKTLKGSKDNSRGLSKRAKPPETGQQLPTHSRFRNRSNPDNAINQEPR